MMVKIRSMAALARQSDNQTVCLYEAKQFPEEYTRAFATSTASSSSTLDPPTNHPHSLPLRGQAHPQRVNESLRNINLLIRTCNAYENEQLGQSTTASAIETNHQTGKNSPDGYCAKLTNKTNHEARAAGYPAHEATDVEPNKQYHTIKACSSKKPKPKQISAIRHNRNKETTDALS